MADARHIVEIILQARDDTAAAFASALGHQEAFNALQKESERQAKETEQAHKQAADSMETASRRQQRSLEELGISSKKAVDAAVELEKATKRHVDIQRDAAASDAQRTQAANDLQKAQFELNKQIREGSDLTAEQARASSKRIRAIADERAQVQNLSKDYQANTRAAQARVNLLTEIENELNREIERGRKETQRKLEQLDKEDHAARMQRRKAEVEAERTAAREREQRARVDAAAGQGRQRELSELSRERARVESEIDRMGSKLARMDMGADASREARKEVAQLRNDYVRFGGDAEVAMRRLGTSIRKVKDDAQGMRTDAEKYLSTIQKIAQVEKQREEAIKGKDLVQKVRLELEKANLEADAAKLAVELRALIGEIPINVDLDSGQFHGQAAEILAAKALIGKDIHLEVDVDVDRALAGMGQAQSRGRGLLSFFKDLNQAASEGFQRTAGQIAAFDNVLRGVMALGITAFFTQIVFGAGAAAGAFLALASSAVYAGAAIGGAITAGVAQAIPALGILVTAISRVKAVTDAVQQASLLQQQQSGQADNAAKRQADTSDTLRSAQERLAEAQDRVNESKAEAIRRTEELILAERRAALGVGEAEDARRAALQQGRIGEVESRRLGVREARFRLSSVRQDLATARDQPGVTDAQKNVVEAQRAVQRAQRGAEAAGGDVTSAAGKLNFLLSQLSAAERRLYTAMTRLQTQWREFAQEISEPLINAFTRSIRRITGLLSGEQLISAARRLSAQMATQFERIFRVFTSPQILNQFFRIMRQAGENLKPLVSIAINLGRAFLNIGEAAGPSLNRMLRFIRDLVRDFRILTEEGRKSGELGKFFEEGAKHLFAWVRLLGAVGRLFLAIAGAGGGADAGLKLIRRLTDGISEFAEAVNTKGSAANQFFRDLFKIMGQAIDALGIIFKSIGKELATLFGEEAGGGGKSMRGFANLVAKVLVPAFFDFLKVMARAVRFVGELVEQNPKVARLVASFMGLLLFGTVISRLRALLSPFTSIISFLIQRLGVMRIAVNLIRLLIERFGVLRFAAAFTGIGAIIALIVFLLVKFKLLDDIWRGLKQTAENFFKAAKPGFDDFMKAVKELTDAFEGGGGLMGTLRTFVTFVTKVAIVVMEEFGRYLGDVVGGAFRVIGNAIRIVVRLLQGDFAGAFSALIDLGKNVIDLFLAPFRGLFRVLDRIFGNVDEKVIGKFSALAEGIIGAFSGIGGVIAGVFEGIVDIVFDTANFAIDAINKLIDLVNKIPDVGPVSIPHIDHIDHLERGSDSADFKTSTVRKGRTPVRHQTGGRIGGGYGGGDRVNLLAEEGEYVVRKEAVRHWGEGVMDFINTLGGRMGFRRVGRGFDEGGPVRGAANTSDVEATEGETRSIMAILRRFGRQAIGSWREIWRDMDAITRRNLNRIEDHVGDGMRRIGRLVRTRGDRIVESMRDTMTNLMRSVYTGFDYVGDATKEALDAFDAKTPKISIPRPRDLTRATGGWVGNEGERGRDGVRTVLGRGEAVLNWAHQKVVNSALWNQHGMTLGDLFRHTDAFHAGGPGQRGYSQGGFTGPQGSGAAFTPISNFAMRKFGLQQTSGRLDHSTMTTSGNVSDHSTGLAGDFSNGVLTPQEDAFSNFWLRKAPEVIKQLIWRNQDQQKGFFVGGHEDHVHLAVLPQYGFDAARMAKIISRAARGMSISSLLAGGTVDVEHVSKIDVEGKGPLALLAQTVINQVRKAANAFIDKIALREAPSTPGASHQGSYEGPLDRLFTNPNTTIGFAQAVALAKRAGFGSSATLFGHIANAESTLRPGIVNEIGATGLWQIYNHPDLEQKYGNMRNPWNNARAAFDLWQAGGTAPWVSSQAAWGQYAAKGGFVGLPSFAIGGAVPGQPGQSQIIEAHAGEWVVNPAQQQKLASLVGATSDKLRSFLGFTGGPFSFQGGGVVRPIAERMAAIRKGEYEIPDLPLNSFNEIIREIRFVGRAMNNLKRKSKDFADNFIANISELTKENGFFDQISANLERFTAQIATRLRLRTFQLVRGTGVVGRLDEEQVADREARNLRRVAGRQGRIDTRLEGVEDDLQQEMNRVRRGLRVLARGGIRGEERSKRRELIKQYELLFEQSVNLRERRQTLDDQIAENLEARFTAAQEAMQRRIERSEDPIQAAERAMREIENRGAGRTSEGFGAMGAQIQALKDQQTVLNRVLRRAQRRGMTDFAREIETQLADLQLAIQEATISMVREQVAAINEQAENREFFAGIGERMLAVRAGLGDTVGAAQGQLGVLNFRRATIEDQLRQLVGIRGTVAATGNQEMIQELEHQIVDLSVALEENTLAQKDATTAVRQAFIDQITRGGAFRTGALGTLGQILQGVTGATGTLTTGTQAELMRQTIAALASTGGGLRDQLFRWLGIDLRNLTGTDFVSAFQNAMASFDEIMVGLTTAEREQFEALINAILENESAVWANTGALNEIIGANQQPQTWSSSAWQWFREALFTGMGDVLPQYQVPAMQTGGYVTRAGLFNLHAGEFVTNPTNNGGWNGSNGDHIDIDIHEAGQPVDATHLASRIAFAKRTRR